MADIQIKGMRELALALQTLPVKIEKNIMRGALRAGAKVIADEAKDNVPVKSGELRRSVRVSARILKTGTVRASAKAGNKKAFYWRFVEFGTAAHLIKAKPGRALKLPGGKVVEQVAHPGARPRPFMRPALDSKADDAVREVAEYVRRRLSTEHGIDLPGPGDYDDPEDA